MKRHIAFLCTASILSFSAPALAEGMPLPERKPILVSADTTTTVKTTKVVETQTPVVSTAEQTPPAKEPVELDTEAFVVSHKSDLMLSCQELRKEVSAMGKIIAETEDVKDRSDIQSKGISAAGAVGSFLVGTVTGGIGLAAAGLMLDHSVSNNQEDADEVQDIAEQRRTWIKGLYTAQACEGPVETPEQEAAIKEAQTNHNVIEKIAKMETAAGKPSAKDNANAPRYEADLNTPYND